MRAPRPGAARQGGSLAVVSLSTLAHPREVMERRLQERHFPRRWIGTAVLEHVHAAVGGRFDPFAPHGGKLVHFLCLRLRVSTA